MTHVRTLLTHSSKIFTALVAAALIFTWTTNAQATHTPADKVVAAGDKIVVAAPQTEVTLLSATLKTSSPTDLILQIAMECSIITDVQTGPSTVAGATDTATAEGKVRAWVEIDGDVVPINSMSEPPQDSEDQEPGDKETDGVTFCNRIHTQEAEDGEDQQDGLDKLRSYIETKNANAFNWLRLNMGNGIHTIEVKADLTVNTSGSALGAEAYVGNRSLIVEPAKLANDATI
jgi:hypothetical protein